MAGHTSAKARATVRRIITRYFGTPPHLIHRQTGGISNLVFSVEHDDGEFIVRMNPQRAKLNPFLKEQWATERARKAGVPAPRVLEVGDDPLPYVILRKSPGEPATQYPDRMRVLHELGGYAALINSIPTHGFGAIFDWSTNQLSPGQDWKDFLEEEYGLDRRLRVLRRHRMLPDRQLRHIRSVLESACGRGRSPMLNHGDLRLKNVLVNKKGNISAILDWEDCISSLAPEWEISVALHDLSIDEKQEFLRGYGVAPRALRMMVPTVKALNVVNYISEIEGFVKAKDSEKLAEYRVRLSGALDLYCL
jgi:hygromycin-B 4-O-kinase